MLANHFCMRRADADGDDVSAAWLAADRQIGSAEIPLLALDLQLGPDRPHLARSQRLRADEFALVLGDAGGFGFDPGEVRARTRPKVPSA